VEEKEEDALRVEIKELLVVGKKERTSLQNEDTQRQ